MNIAKVGLIACTALSLPVVASAQSAADKAYCHRLGTLWREYNYGSDPATGIATALTQCNSNTAGSTATLEKALKDGGFTLPKKM